MDKTEILKKALADIKTLARELKMGGLKAKYGPEVEPDEGMPAEEAMDATEGGEPGEGLDLGAPEAPPEEEMDDDKIAQLVAMMGKK